MAPKTLKIKYFLPAVVIIILWSAGIVTAAGQIFSDVPSGYWAESSIARMNIKGVITGYKDGSFGVYKPVTRLEMTAMLIRTMGLEPEEDEVIPLAFKDADSIPLWGKKYIAAAVDQGLITGEDLVNFRALESAKRYEVAQFIGKAMGLDKSASDHESDKLSFTDAADIPLGAKGYAALLNEMGIMTGNADGTFKPLQNVTRAEMAVLMAKVDRILDKLTENEVSGLVKEVRDDRIVLETRDGQGTVYLYGSVNVFLNGKPASLTDLLSWDMVYIVKDGITGGVVEAERQSEINGTVKQVSVTITDERGFERILVVNDDTRVRKDGDSADIKDISPGDSVEVRLEGNTATRIYASTTVIKEQVKGKVLEVDTDDGYLTLAVFEDENEDEQNIKVWTDSDTQVVTIDGRISSRLSRINEDDMVIVVGNVTGGKMTAVTIIVTETE